MNPAANRVNNRPILRNRKRTYDYSKLPRCPVCESKLEPLDADIPCTWCPIEKAILARLNCEDGQCLGTIGSKIAVCSLRMRIRAGEGRAKKSEKYFTFPLTGLADRVN